jgi:hypothetical protein
LIAPPQREEEFMKSVLSISLVMISCACTTTLPVGQTNAKASQNICSDAKQDSANKATEGVGLGLTSDWDRTRNGCAEKEARGNANSGSEASKDMADKAQEGIGIGLTNDWDRARGGFAANQQYFALQQDDHSERCAKLKRELEHEASLGIAYGLVDDRDRKYAMAGCK